jgi:hypothetical protein
MNVIEVPISAEDCAKVNAVIPELVANGFNVKVEYTKNKTLYTVTTAKGVKV